MASIRRTLSPALNDRLYQNGTAVSSPYSPASHKLLPNGNSKYQSVPHLPLFSALSLLSRRGWRRSFYRCLIFLLLGFLFGMTPFGNIETDIQTQDFTLPDLKPPFVNVQLDDQSINSVSLTVDKSLEDQMSELEPRKQLIIVTPTYNRAFQAYFLNRLGQLLRLVKPPVLWIIVEEKSASFETAEILRKTGVMYRHLVTKVNSSSVKDRGVHQRNAALEHMERHKLDGIVYFADDDNVYSLELFESLRGISRFGTWPVAMLTPSKNKAILEGPICNGTQVIGWHTNEKSKRLRRFHVDMSGFAFNSTILWDPKRWKRPFRNSIRQLDTVKEGFQETTFIEQVVEDESQMEGTPPGCSRIQNWHLHLDTKNLVYPRGWLLQENLDVILPIQ
ncbi:hypothetical protein SLEP1_g30147 [Rubroshorea leprosula]|uniref:Glycosyltransferases n=1 Tax=Rubroshorea leprosula TaxID=152421 RepID=A0AAV5K7S1_9ROSI|nr:hypothetical protein SLEP1_g30147 [Rubroshorea leprosula]